MKKIILVILFVLPLISSNSYAISDTEVRMIERLSDRHITGGKNSASKKQNEIKLKGGVGKAFKDGILWLTGSLSISSNIIPPCASCDIYEGGSYSAAKRHDLLMGIDRDKSGKISVKLKFDHTDNLRWKKTKKETILETIIPKANKKGYHYKKIDTYKGNQYPRRFQVENTKSNKHPLQIVTENGNDYYVFPIKHNVGSSPEMYFVPTASTFQRIFGGMESIDGVQYSITKERAQGYVDSVISSLQKVPNYR